MSGWSQIASTTARPPLTRLTTPEGRSHSASRRAIEPLRQRHLLGGLDDEGVAGRDRERQEPERHHRRKVEGRDRRADADRLTDDLAVDAGRDVLQAVAHHQRRRPAGDLHALDAPAHAAARLVEGLAVLAGDGRGELLEVLLEQLPEAEEESGANDRRRVSPGGEGLLRRGDGGVELPGGRERGACDRLARRGVVNVQKVGGPRRDPAAADEVFENFQGDLVKREPSAVREKPTSLGVQPSRFKRFTRGTVYSSQSGQPRNGMRSEGVG